MTLKRAPHRIIFTELARSEAWKPFACLFFFLFFPLFQIVIRCTPPPLRPASFLPPPPPPTLSLSISLAASWFIIPVIQRSHHSAAESGVLFRRVPLSARRAANSRPLEACCHFHSQIWLLQRNGSHIAPHPTRRAELNTSLLVVTAWLICLHKDWWTPTQP